MPSCLRAVLVFWIFHITVGMVVIEKEPSAATMNHFMNNPPVVSKLPVQSVLLESRNMEEAMNSEHVINQPKLKVNKLEMDQGSAAEPGSAVVEEESSVALDFMEQPVSKPNGCSTYGKWMIAVVSAPDHFAARKAIRVTWSSRAKAHGIPVKFFVGKIDPKKEDQDKINLKLLKEQNENDDMVRPDSFIESYHNLTAKAISIFQYGYRNCFNGLMKVDDDTFLNVDRLKWNLDQESDLTDLWGGDFFWNSPVVKNPEGRWFAYDQYPYEQWPVYANGPGFFLGRKGMARISEMVMKEDPRLDIRIDDAAVGVWLDGTSIRRKSFVVDCFRYQLRPWDAVWHNPVSSDEMYNLQGGEDVVLQACSPESVTGCLCSGSPHFSHEKNMECWHQTANNFYADVIPRMSHAVL